MNIPQQALEAGARAITMALILAVEEDCRALALTDDERTELARAAFLAIVEAWPGMSVADEYDLCAIRKGWITLPQEASDGQ